MTSEFRGMNMGELEGAFTALITPFQNNGALDEEGLRQNVDFQIDKGIAGLVPCGTTGESATLSHEEHRKVVEIVIDQANDRVPVIAGTGSNSTAEAVALTKHAVDAGADFCLMITPYYNKPTQRGLIAHFRAVAAETQAKIILYNVPSRTGRNMEASTVIQLSDVDNIVGIKEASADLAQIMQIIRGAGEGFTVLSGDDMTNLPIMAAGGRGVISVVSNVVPDMVQSMVADFLAGRLGESRKTHYKLLPLFKDLFLETNPGPVKEAMNQLGMAAGPLRLPMVECEASTVETIRKDLKDLGLL
jgi:4-hydroxy-tetrahydrodipicolinate synthase